jgi:hypothetical protein
MNLPSSVDFKSELSLEIVNKIQYIMKETDEIS